ncbi:uncharacterized protein KQ657_005141 [Scheffersomyces spartinae]|uniref:DUF1742-domain-containing protein n=1 Tax=Scheffersomyces spartinae TaxID=45513 RepID=A0A9P7V9U6_9ASCO|nr:uncharacterized protein KQ657_005141 [Scheffersomyces spartinae]KAG7193942.1 hypothetical protein KQ657_005141 [Scheffersomyces spartinae]
MTSAEPPFPNLYRSRLVSENDLRSCVVCFKFTTTVMLADNKADFFYVCAGHLKDTNFCDPIHSDEYLGWIRERDRLYKRISELKRKMDDEAWNKYLPTKWIGKSRAKDEDKNKHKADDDDDDDEKKTDEVMMKKMNKELETVLDKISGYSSKDFKLNKDVYRMRLQRYHNQKVQAKRQQEIQSDPGFFPQVPTNKLGDRE